jgi:hypothetical protein
MTAENAVMSAQLTARNVHAVVSTSVTGTGP